ncbi:LacI family DNA-binding transcriptional regulator [Paenibacillus sp. J2TS4]|uniref:LacI family DNA-binding transcriptional regulator n=1 Tax=Paenibacillus sp. J2TS4 TaxID=2807194 RepID=UPI001AFF0369|nr:LacI family DNA-binding transcriptional regulator [Paenibacillus sp. J2TS4]GIP31093.1 LacI family transcriptional regulator [Paenibacillus sp. J2TS4]
MTVTKKDIADHLGISRTAVSLVLNNTPNSTVSEDTRHIILKAAKELGYRDNEIYPKICYILYNREPDDPLYIHDLRMIENVASQNDYRLIFMNVRSTINDFATLSKYLSNKEVSGVVISGDIDDDILDILEESGVPYVVYSGLDKENVNVIVTDVVNIAYEATKYLTDLGHQRIALFSGTLDTLVHQDTLKGYIKALEEAGLPYDKSLVQVSKEEDGHELANRMAVLEIDYTAAFCVNSVIQFGALQKLKDLGLQVPKDISLVGWGYSELLKMSVPPLTSFYTDSSEKEIVVDRLIEIITEGDKDPRTIYLKSIKLYEGGTVSSFGQRSNRLR